MNRHQDSCFCLFISLFAYFLKSLMISSWQLGLPKVGLFEQISKFVCNPWVRIHPKECPSPPNVIK